jgi:signal transduction histidine kinase
VRSRTIPRGVRIVGGILVGVVLYLLGVFVSAMALTANAWAFSAGELNDTGIACILLLILAWGTVFLRTRWPWVPFAIGGVLTVGWGDALLLLIALFHLVLRAPRRQAIAASAVGSAVVVFAMVRMCLAPAERNPFSIFFLPDPAQVSGIEASTPPDDSHLAIRIITVAAGVIGLAAALGVGVLLRRTKRMRTVESIAQREALRNESLSAELARQSERELLARELHDTLSHRLSVISLHTGALEVGSQTDPEVASTASALRQEARASLEDLRHLVGGVRNGSLSDLRTQRESAAPPNRATMAAIPQLVASVQSTGTTVRPLIIIQDVDACPPALDRAIYRIVQESLTNALKHAPGAPVTVDVTVSAAEGARITVTNPLSHTPGMTDVPPRPHYAPGATRGFSRSPTRWEFGRAELRGRGYRGSHPLRLRSLAI